jgi:hypothetical protein
VCSLCSDGKFSTPGSPLCETEVPAFQVTISFPLLFSSFTSELQSTFSNCISQVSNIPESQVIIIAFNQIRSLNSTRRLLGRILQVHTEIKTIRTLFQVAIVGMTNKTALDALFQRNGLPASTALDMQLYCEVGQFSAPSSSACTACSVGTYSSMAGPITSCNSCPTGVYSTGVGSTVCSDQTMISPLSPSSSSGL